MLSTGSLDISGLNGDNGAIGVGNESGVGDGVGISSSIGNGGNGGGDTVSGKVLSLGSLDLRGLSGGNSAVGVGDETASVGIGVASMGIGVASSVVSVVVTVVEAVVETGISVRSISALGSKVGSLGSLDLRGLGGGNGTVGVGHQLSRGSSHASEKNLFREKLTPLKIGFLVDKRLFGLTKNFMFAR